MKMFQTQMSDLSEWMQKKGIYKRWNIHLNEGTQIQ
jgi:hypothetical protein